MSKRFLAIGLSAAALVALAVWALAGRRAVRAADEDDDKEKPIAAASRVTRTPSGETVIKLDEATQARLGLKAAALAPASRRSEATAYGKLEEDPAAAFVVRAPVSGRLAAGAWPALGQSMADGAVVGSVEPRIAPMDRVALAGRRAAAQADLSAAAAALTAARASFERLRKLNADDKNVSDRAVEEARARVNTEEARVAAGQRTVKALEGSLPAVPLVVERGGQAVEIAARPGEAVESGQPLLRVARLDRLIARVDVPAGERVPSAASARIVAVGYEDRPLEGKAAGLAASVDPKTQGQAFLFRVSGAGLGLRPALAETAYLALPGAAREGVILPRAAVVRYQGRAWVYVETAPGQYARREVALEEVTAGGVFTRSLAGGARVVATGAQMLLSEELKSQIQVGEENPA